MALPWFIDEKSRLSDAKLCELVVRQLTWQCCTLPPDNCHVMLVRLYDTHSRTLTLCPLNFFGFLDASRPKMESASRYQQQHFRYGKKCFRCEAVTVRFGGVEGLVMIYFIVILVALKRKKAKSSPGVTPQ